MHPAGKAALTPLTVVRDVVDAPLVTITNVFEYWADRTDPVPRPGANVGWTWRGGFDFGLGFSFTGIISRAFSWVFGGVDYVIGRSLWPNWPRGLSPWLDPGESWGSLYFPSTRALWRDADEPVPYPGGEGLMI
jgi:hypothetical protein